MFFVIPEMPSKTFVMLYKKLPDHFNATLSHCFNTHKETLSIKQRQEDKEFSVSDHIFYLEAKKKKKIL